MPVFLVCIDLVVELFKSRVDLVIELFLPDIDLVVELFKPRVDLVIELLLPDIDLVVEFLQPNVDLVVEFFQPSGDFLVVSCPPVVDDGVQPIELMIELVKPQNYFFHHYLQPCNTRGDTCILIARRRLVKRVGRLAVVHDFSA